MIVAHSGNVLRKSGVAMRLFAITEAGDFVEYQEKAFREEHREETIESWLASNPDCISEQDTLLIIGRQVSTNLHTAIDLLAVDEEGNTAVIELKRDRTPRETLAQALEYASFVEQLDYQQLDELFQEYTGEEGISLAEAHRTHFGLTEDEAASFNKDQRIIIVGSAISPAVRQTCAFL
ncbi:MAG: hypothetical protein ACLFV5_12730, partial [Anaerolineales bacterium]